MYTNTEVILLNIVPPEVAANLIKHAQMISSSKYGHFVDFNREYPPGRQPFTFPDDCEILKSKHAFGELLFIKEKEGIETVAFIFDHSFLPKQ